MSCRRIEAGEELLYDYGVVIPKNSTGTVACNCQCRKRKCRRWVY